jgi:quercetin dioxygenase-like cupin family protein
VNVVDIYSLVEFSQEKGLLDTMGKRRQVKKDLLQTKNFNILLVCLESGQEIPTRPEPYNVCFYVIEGKGVFTVDDEQKELTKGNVIFVPANVARGIQGTERLSILGIQDAH